MKRFLVHYLITAHCVNGDGLNNGDEPILSFIHWHNAKQ